MKNIFKNSKAGDKVWSKSFGWGEIVCIEFGAKCPIHVAFDGVDETFTIDGRLDHTDNQQDIFLKVSKHDLRYSDWKMKRSTTKDHKMLVRKGVTLISNMIDPHIHKDCPIHSSCYGVVITQYGDNVSCFSEIRRAGKHFYYSGE